MKIRHTLTFLLLALANCASPPSDAPPLPDETGLLYTAPADWRFAFHLHKSLRSVDNEMTVSIEKTQSGGVTERLSLAVIPATDVASDAFKSLPHEMTGLYRLKETDIPTVLAWRADLIRDRQAGKNVETSMGYTANRLCAIAPLPTNVLPLDFSFRTPRMQSFRRISDQISAESIEKLNNLSRHGLPPCAEPAPKPLGA